VRRRLVAVAVLVVAAAGVSAGACSSGGASGEAQPDPGPTIVLAGEPAPVPVRRLTAAVEGLCTALQQAPDSPAAAEATFYDQSHATLHAIARALEDVDRPAAAALLEAKQRVEADFAGGLASGGRVADDLRPLVAATSAGLARLEVKAPACE
jgi:hypothetical protein